MISLHKRGQSVEKYILATLTEYFGKLRVSDLSAEDPERYKDLRSKSIKPATVNREMEVAKHMLTKAVEWKIITNNPFRTVRSLSIAKSMERVLGQDEEIKLLGGCEHVRSCF
jgi:hypothetical protein